MLSNNVLRYDVLGTFRVRRAGDELDLGWAKQQAVLATLVLEMNRYVPVDDIAAAVWGSRPPRDIRNAVQTYVSRLRRLLEPDRHPGDIAGVLVSGGDGYMVRGDPRLLDLTIFEEFLQTAGESHQNGAYGCAMYHVEEALKLWRGEPFSGLRGPGIEALRRRLGELRLTALELRAELWLEERRWGDAIADLTRLVAEHPLREHTRALLMLALYGAKRQADALAVFTDIRRRLVQELGIDPGPELRSLHQQILRGDQNLVARSALRA